MFGVLVLATQKGVVKSWLGPLNGKLKQCAVDTLVAVGSLSHGHTELFKLSSLDWQTKFDYPFSKDIYAYSITVLENKFFVFGGHSWKRRVLKNQDIFRR